MKYYDWFKVDMDILLHSIVAKIEMIVWKRLKIKRKGHLKTSKKILKQNDLL